MNRLNVYSVLHFAPKIGHFLTRVKTWFHVKIKFFKIIRMWANAQRDGRRALFNAAKFG